MRNWRNFQAVVSGIRNRLNAERWADMGLAVMADGKIVVEWSYSGFHEFRIALAKLIGVDLTTMEGFTKDGKPWSAVDDAIVPLLNHSDCDGTMTPDECAAVSPRLRELIALWSDEDADEGWHRIQGTKAGIASKGRSWRTGWITARHGVCIWNSGEGVAMNRFGTSTNGATMELETRLELANAAGEQARSAVVAGILSAVGAVDPIRWTDEKPTEAGPYWWREREDAEPEMVGVRGYGKNPNETLCVYATAFFGVPVDMCDGQFSTRIPLPV